MSKEETLNFVKNSRELLINIQKQIQNVMQILQYVDTENVSSIEDMKEDITEAQNKIVYTWKTLQHIENILKKKKDD